MNDVQRPSRRHCIEEEQNAGYATLAEPVNGRGRRAFAGAQAFRAATAAPCAQPAENVPPEAQPNAKKNPQPNAVPQFNPQFGNAQHQAQFNSVPLLRK